MEDLTGQDLLNRMEIFNAELQNQVSESDVSRSLVALNMAQDHFEGMIATHSKSFGGQTTTISQTQQVESTAFPTGFLRIDALHYLDPTTNRPAWQLTPLYRTMGHSPSQYWPYNLLVQSVPGVPRAYFTDGTNIYWDPLPDSSSNAIRVSGFKTASDITAGGAFAYPDICANPFSGFAARLMKLSLDDDASQMAALAEEFFAPVIKVLGNFERARAHELEYTRLHEA